jgi:hypothetical protein
MEEPTISAAEYPKIRSAAAFQLRMVPSSVLLMMASSEDSTIAASRAAVSAIWSGLGVVESGSVRQKSPHRGRGDE